MLLSRLAKASTEGQMTSNQTGSGNKRATLSVFNQLRQTEDFSEEYRTKEEESFELDQDLFREINELSPALANKKVSCTRSHSSSAESLTVLSRLF